MSNLWRTQRPRFHIYQSDGLGRDYYIKFTNGGFWENQFVLSKKPDYVRHKYNNFHSLFHMAAPFKYWGDGSGREHYILKANGLFHDQKPLCSYELTDFLRNGKNIKGVPDNFRKKLYLSVSEIKYNQKLRSIEKKLVKRLYTEPMKKKKKICIDVENGNKDKYGNRIDIGNLGYQTCGPFMVNDEKFFKKKFNTLENQKVEGVLNKQISYDGKINKNLKTLDNNTLLPKFRKTMNINNFNNKDKGFNTVTNNENKKKAKKIQFLTPKNNNLVNNKYDTTKDNCDEDMGYKKVIVNSKLLNKKIKIV